MRKSRLITFQFLLVGILLVPRNCVDCFSTPTQNPSRTSSSTQLFLEAGKPSSVFQQLDQLVNDAPRQGLLDLRGESDGYRGVYLTQAVSAGEELLRVDLNQYCVCDDDFLPDWLTIFDKKVSQTASNEDNMYSQQWVVRLAAMLLDAYLSTTKTPVQELWFALMPDAILRKTLPIHWSEETVSATECRQLEVAVDSMFFGRQEAIEKLWTELRAARPDQPLNVQWFEDILDLVQTRVCRLQKTTEDNTLRCLAPVFDCINHHPVKANAEFGVQDSNFLVVSAIQDIGADQEVLINYGASSTQPAWKCLLSYGFFVTDSDVDEDLFPVELSSGSHVLGRTGVPPDLMDPPTCETAERLIESLEKKRAAMQKSSKVADGNDESMHLAMALKAHHTDILRDCIENLEEWIDANDTTE